MYDCGFTKGNHWFRFRTGGIIIKDNKMLFVKNFFKGVGGAIDGFDCHTMEFYYLMTIQEDCVDTNRKETDEGEELVWVPIEEIPDSDINPSFMKEYIKEITNGDKIIHIIWEKDR